MEKTKKLIENSIRMNPLALLTISNPALIDIANNFLPYSAGFEFEVFKQSCFKLHEFNDIPNILAVNIDNNEQRFRIPNGLNGFICLYFICEKLKLNSYYDINSSIHYHTDMRRFYCKISDEFIKENNDWIIDEVATWGEDFKTKEGRCSRLRGWVRFHDNLKTLEIRLGEITFDYKTIVNRLLHCQRIVQKIEKNLNKNPECTFDKETHTINLEYLKNLKTPFCEIRNKVEEKFKRTDLEVIIKQEDTVIDIKDIMSKRIIKF